MCGLAIAVLSVSFVARAAAQQPLPIEGDEAALIAVLESDGEEFDKMKACQRLAVIGTAQSIPVLAELLADEKLAHYARFALEPIDDPAVDETLRNALDEVDGELKIGVINSLGMRRDAKSVDALVSLLSESEGDVSAAAAAALGRIATPEAVAALRTQLQQSSELQAAVADACLSAVDMLIQDEKNAKAVELCDAVYEADVPQRAKIAALHGIARADETRALAIIVEQLPAEERSFFGVALQIAQKMTGPDVTAALVKQLPTLSPERQALVIYVLGDRGDRDALPSVLAAAESEYDGVRLAAVETLASLGDASAVSLLLEIAVGGSDEIAERASESLAELPGDEVDASLASLLATSDGRQQLLLTRLAGQRGIGSVVPTLFDLTDSDDTELREAAYGSLGLTVGLDEFPTLLGHLLSPSSEGVRDVVKQSLQRACQRMPDREVCANTLLDEMESAATSSQADLLDLLGVVGGETALEGVSQAALEGSEPVQDAATRVLGDWSTPAAAPVLLKLAQQDDSKFQIRSLRGYIRIIRQFDLPDEERLAMCREAFDIAQRNEEKQLLLDTLTRIPSPAALDLAASFLGDEELKEDAGRAAVAIGRRIVDRHPKDVARAMQQTIDASVSDALAKQADRLLKQANAKLEGA